MFKKSELLKRYGLWLKVGLIAIFFVCLGGMNCITQIKEIPNYPVRNQGLNDWDRPQSYVGEDFEDWKKRKEPVDKELEIIYKRAQDKGENYTLVDYFQDIEQLFALEDKYKFFLTSPGMLGPLVRLRDARGMWKSYQPNSEEQKYIASIQKKMSQRDGLDKGSSDFNAGQVGTSCLSWLLEKYLIIMLFWGLIYIIRFEEHNKALRRFSRHHSELGRFINVEEPFPGMLSFYDEMLIAPWRFALRMILWPKYCWNYPRYESPAQMLRFNRLKAEFLRYKPVGYQLTSREEVILLSQAKKPVKDIQKAVASLFQFPALVRRSAYIGYLSLIFGVLFQPAISLAASYSQKVDAHFFGNNRLSLIEHQKDSGTQIRDGTSSMQDDDHHDFYGELICALNFEFCQLRNPLSVISFEVFPKLKEIVFAIEKVPLHRLFGPVRCLATVNQAN